jgi:5'-nucleotidase
MKILVTNDDGIQASGLWALAEELATVGDIVVVAPAQDQSGKGMAISPYGSVCLRQVEPRLAGVHAFAVDGTPADSVILATEAMDDIRLVVSGINPGPNMALDVLHSGTVSAALQGYVHGLLSVAVSVNAREDARYDVAARLAKLLARMISQHGLEPILLNVNVPNISLNEVRGVDLTHVCGVYHNMVNAAFSYPVSSSTRNHNCEKQHSAANPVERAGDWDRHRVNISGPWWFAEEGTDLFSVENGRISITPLQGEPNTAERISLLQDLTSFLFRELLSPTQQR